MRIIHTGDLHLGRNFHEKDLVQDQRFMLDALRRILVECGAEVLLIAGDIYDRAIPPPEAIALFDSFLTQAKDASPGLVVVAIPGNHDSAARLSFAAGLLCRAGLHIRSRPEDVVDPIVVEKDGKRFCFWALPYLNPGAFSGPVDGASPQGDGSPDVGPSGPARPLPEKAAGGAQGELFKEVTPAVEGPAPAMGGHRSQAELFAEAMDRIQGRLDPGDRNILVAHCFATGGIASESERAFVGAAEEVSGECFEAFDYVALGHLHRRQAAGKRARYPGSPLAYSFAEAEASPEKGFLVIDLDGQGFVESFRPFAPLHRVTRLSGSFAELTTPGAFADFRDDYVEARLLDPKPVLDPADPLRVNFPNLLSVRQAAFDLDLAGGPEARAAAGAEARPRGGEDGAGAVMSDFRAFHEDMNLGPVEEGTAALFAVLLEEASHASD